MQLPVQIPFTCITVGVVGKRKADECQQIKGGSSQTQHRSRIGKSHIILKTKSAPQNTFRQNIWRLFFICKTFFLSSFFFWPDGNIVRNNSEKERMWFFGGNVKRGQWWDGFLLRTVHRRPVARARMSPFFIQLVNAPTARSTAIMCVQSVLG